MTDAQVPLPGGLAEPQPVPANPYPPAFVPLPVPTSRPRRTGLLIAGVVALVLVILAGAAAIVLLNPTPLQVVVSGPTSHPGATSSPTITASPTEPPPYTGRLQDLVLPMPSGATRRPLKMGDPDGSLSQDQLLQEYFDPAARPPIAAFLTKLGYQRGVFISWFDHKARVQIQIYQFSHASGAAEWIENARIVDSGDPTTLESAGVGEIPGSFLYKHTPPSGGLATHAEYSKGALTVQIDIFDPPDPSLNYVRDMAIQQYHRLP